MPRSLPLSLQRALLAVALATGALTLPGAAQDSSGTSKETRTVRERALERFDADGDGRLNAAEREAIRKAGSPFAVYRPPYRRYRRGRGDKERIKKFDKNGDGKLDADERRAERRELEQFWGKLVGQYRAFENDRPVVENLRRMERDAKAGKIKGFPSELYGWIRGSIDRAKPRNGRQQPPAPRESHHILASFDENKDGRLDADELAAIRAAIAAKIAPTKDDDR